MTALALLPACGRGQRPQLSEELLAHLHGPERAGIERAEATAIAARTEQASVAALGRALEQDRLLAETAVAQTEGERQRATAREEQARDVGDFLAINDASREGYYARLRHATATARLASVEARLEALEAKREAAAARELAALALRELEKVNAVERLGTRYSGVVSATDRERIILYEYERRHDAERWTTDAAKADEEARAREAAWHDAEQRLERVVARRASR
jgi:hypothetical protein